jgi:hypothetical protein
MTNIIVPCSLCHSRPDAEGKVIAIFKMNFDNPVCLLHPEYAIPV